MNDDIAKMLLSFVELLILSALTIAAPLIVYVDSVIIGDGVSEYSVTEITQEILLLCSTLVFFVGASRHHESCGFLVLVGGFFACMLIRELDFLFDMIHHGCWIYPALLTASISIVIAVANRETVVTSIVAYSGSKSCIYVTIGLLIVIILSRLFGSGRLIWDAVMGTEYKTEYKAIIQEGLELFGYMFIFYGSWLLPKRH